jgi:GNAT superfamily N-acetyltransferase
MAIGSYAMADETTAEVAFVVREDYQGQGVASYLLGELERIAKLNDYKKFTATVLRENKGMLHVFSKRYPNARTLSDGGADVTIMMDFDDAAQNPPPPEARGAQ